MLSQPWFFASYAGCAFKLAGRLSWLLQRQFFLHLMRLHVAIHTQRNSLHKFQ
jgi:hypothetical protein